MLRAIVGWMGIALAGAACLQAAPLQSSSPALQDASTHRAALSRYCVTCHNEKLKTAGLMLDKMNVEKVPEGAPVWEKVIRKLRTGAMPPVGAPRPDKATYDSLATYFETALDKAAAANPNPGRPVIHRLNRTEYTNAIRDLLAVDVDLESLFPADLTGYGFDNIGDVLSISPTLLEGYMSAARKISRLAVGDPASGTGLTKYELPRLLLQEDRMSEDLPFGSRGGIAIKHYFPQDGEYALKIHLMTKAGTEVIFGLDDPSQLDVRLDGARIQMFTVGGGNKNSGRPAGVYEQNADSSLEVRFPAKAGMRVVAVDFLKEPSVPEGLSEEPRHPSRRQDEPAVNYVTIAGPYDAKGPGETASRRRIFTCHPTGTQDEEACAKKILIPLAQRAYRRPATDEEIRSLLNFYKEGRSRGDFEAGIEMALRRILVSLPFLVRIELDPPNVAPDTAFRISDLELASRLSFFLWSSIPDEPLLALAERGKLKDPAVLDQQVRRMLADKRSKALVDNFAGEWLQVRNLKLANPDADAFPYFDENLREAMERETELFFESMLREDHSVLDLLNADYTFVNERLAQFYGIPNVHGSRFQRVKVNNEERRGLLGQASILTVTSYAYRTSPTLRGKWVLENILGAPPPPPPPNVPSLKDRGEDGKALSVRGQMEQHRADPACAVCHARMDPLGFALENFDALGKWRTTISASNTPIDASGALPDGTKFNGPAELRTILLSHPEQFATAVTEKLLTYALGREVEFYDQPAVRKITRDAAANNYRWSSLILGIATSTPFQMRRSQAP
jgi:uncharacterized protein DUF1592/uncharacterized protein DUF1588/uncharacterized protein DUF1585/uncharacterized protein DUF1587/uncharacterized protein DUF1595